MLGWCPNDTVQFHPGSLTNVHRCWGWECPSRVSTESIESPPRVSIKCPLSVHRVSIESPQSVHLECPLSPSRVLRRARRFLLLQVTCASSVGLPGLRGGVRACGSFLIKLIAKRDQVCADTGMEGHLVSERNHSGHSFLYCFTTWHLIILWKSKFSLKLIKAIIFIAEQVYNFNDLQMQMPNAAFGTLRN